MSHNNIAIMIKEGRLAEAAAELDALITSDCADAEAWYLRGKLWWKTGNRSEAMTCYSRSLALNSESPAKYALNQAKDIADFFNPDLLNP